MEVVWKQEKATVREAWENLGRRKPIAYTTVMTVMDNLFRKGYLKRQKCGKAYCYTPAQPRQKFLQKNVARLVKQLLAEHGELATVQFVKQSESIDHELRQRLLDDLKKHA